MSLRFPVVARRSAAPAAPAVFALLGAALLGAGLIAVPTVAAAPPPGPAAVAPSGGDLRSMQQENAKLFYAFKTGLLRLAQKFQQSDKPEDQDKAKVIYAALDLTAKSNVDNQFQQLVAGMTKGTGNLQDLEDMLREDKQLTQNLRQILDLLMTDDESAKRKAEITRLQDLIKEAAAIKRAQEMIRAMTENQRGDPEKLAKAQHDTADRTSDLAKNMGGKVKDGGTGGDPGEQPVSKSEPKSEAKGGDPAGDGKSDTDESKAESKDGLGEAGADGKPGEPKPSDGKPSDGKPGDGKPGDGKPSDGKPGDGKPSDGKPGDGKPSDGKPGDGKPSDGKPGDGKPSDGKPGDQKPGDGKPGDNAQAGKPSDPKSENKSQGEGKGESKQAKGEPGGEGKPQGGKPSDTQQASASKGGGSPPKPGGQSGQPGQPGGQQQAQKPPAPGREHAEEAYPHQKAAEGDLKKNDRADAGKNEDKAIEELSKVIEELEKRLKQLREEEMLKLLADLEARTNRMLAMQIEVYEQTKAIDATIKANGERTTAETQKSQQQSDKEGLIIQEANTSLKLLESEGTAVAFARVLEEVRQDMMFVKGRLFETRVEADTQAIGENIISLLKDMADALKKAQQEIKDQQNKPQNPPPPGEQKPQDRKLIDLLAELKLIRSLQQQVNSRTKIYGEQTAPDKPRDPLVEAELRQLSARQDKLEGMIHDIATGANE